MTDEPTVGIHISGAVGGRYTGSRFNNMDVGLRTEWSIFEMTGATFDNVPIAIQNLGHSTFDVSDSAQYVDPPANRAERRRREKDARRRTQRASEERSQ